MYRKIVNIIIWWGISITAYPQLQPLLDQYLLNGMAINPAYAGSQEALNIGLYARAQWVGFEGAPRDITFTIHTPMRDKHVSLGLMVMNDKLGSRTETGFLLNYAYRIDIWKGKLSFGLAAGLTSLSTDVNMLRYTDPGDGLLLNPGVKALLPEFSFGIYYYSDKFFSGLSMPLFLKHPFDGGTGKYRVSFNPSEMNYLLMAGYIFTLSDNFKLLPSMLLKTNPSNNTQLDLNCNLIFREKVWLGTSLRTNRNLTFLLQYQANRQLRIAYSYGYEFSELSSFQKGSHEVMLLYNFRYEVNVKSPRYF
jgi:type IX secretion system PorP/SprF family membrane protein